jgi:hypothetical protein
LQEAKVTVESCEWPCSREITTIFLRKSSAFLFVNAKVGGF